MKKKTHPFFFSLLDHKIGAGEEGANSRTYSTQNKAAKVVCIKEKVIIWLTFNPGLALTGFQTVFNKLFKIELHLQKK